MAKNKWVGAVLVCDICDHTWSGTFTTAQYNAAGEHRIECPNCGFLVAAPNRGSVECAEAEDGGSGESEQGGMAGCPC